MEFPSRQKHRTHNVDNPLHSVVSLVLRKFYSRARSDPILLAFSERQNSDEKNGFQMSGGVRCDHQGGLPEGRNRRTRTGTPKSAQHQLSLKRPPSPPSPGSAASEMQGNRNDNSADFCDSHSIVKRFRPPHRQHGSHAR